MYSKEHAEPGDGRDLLKRVTSSGPETVVKLGEADHRELPRSFFTLAAAPAVTGPSTPRLSVLPAEPSTERNLSFVDAR